MRIETMGIDTLDGVHLAADLALVADPVGGVVLAHPHPRYGGHRHHPLIDALFRSLPDAGWATIRFDFRGGGDSSGEHDGEGAERLDVCAALDTVQTFAGDGPLWLVGYSFGALVCLDVVDPRVHGWVGIAPPLGPAHRRPLAADDHRPVTLFVPDHDQFAPPETVAETISGWKVTTMHTVPMADHFLLGQVQRVAEQAAEVLIQR